MNDKSKIVEFRHELSAMVGLLHPNIMGLIAVIFEGNVMALLTKYAENGSLQDFLEKRYKFNQKKVIIISVFSGRFYVGENAGAFAN